MASNSKQRKPMGSVAEPRAFAAAGFLSALIENLADKIISNVQNFRGSKDRLVLYQLRYRLMKLRYLLDDAEEKQYTNLAVREWLHDLKDAVWDADNLLDEVNTRALTLKIEAESQTFGDQVWAFFSSPSRLLGGRINSGLAELLQKLNRLLEQRFILRLEVGVSKSTWQSTATTSVVGQSTIYGRDDEMNKLKKYLLSNDDCYDHVGVITIAGRAGVGKTTLAQLLYNDQEAQGYFDLKAWTCITKEFDAFRVTKTLLESVSGKPVVTNNLNDLQVELQQRLSGKKFLFVLDDLWDTYNDWDRLKTILKSGRAGSRVIVTTQENVALGMNTFPVHYLTPLSDEQCWELFAEHAFGSKQPSIDKKLEMIGRKVADKCCGLPLAVKVLGGLLQSNLSEKDWYKVLESNIWDLPDNEFALSFS